MRITAKHIMKRVDPSRRSWRRSGFTLVEVLVTISIVIVLAALMTIGLRSLKDSANAAKCMGNLKNLTVAAVTASVDNNGRFPAMRVFPWDPDGYLAGPDSGFYSESKPLSIGEVLGPHLGFEPISTMDIDPALMPEVLQCPLAMRNTRKAWINRFGAYRYNYYAIGRSPAPPGAMIFTDTCWNDWPVEDFSHQEPAGLNVAYADGHVRFMTHADYMKVNPAGSEEKYNRFFTQGWLD
jgi:prepilin-type processing-associated H-X9-DG protein